MSKIETIGIIGAGQMGGGIAHVSALAGYKVLLHDTSADRIEKGIATEETTFATAKEFVSTLDKTITVAEDFPAFIVNRILLPMINEAIYSLYEGVAGVEEIDTVMKLGMAHPMGPLQLADFIGLDVCLSILHVLHDGFGNPKYAPCPLLTNMVTAGYLGVKSGEGFYKYTPGSKDLVVSERFGK